jgi:hypothetical protein
MKVDLYVPYYVKFFALYIQLGRGKTLLFIFSSVSLRLAPIVFF